MAYKPFKMRGSPMKRNFGIDPKGTGEAQDKLVNRPKSPAKHTPTESKGQKYINEVTGSEDYADVYDRTVVAHNDKHQSDPNFTHEGDQPQFSYDRAVRGRKSGPDDPGYAEKKEKQYHEERKQKREKEADKSPAKDAHPHTHSRPRPEPRPRPRPRPDSPVKHSKGWGSGKGHTHGEKTRKIDKARAAVSAIGNWEFPGIAGEANVGGHYNMKKRQYRQEQKRRERKRSEAAEKKSPAKQIGLVPGVGVTAKAVKRKKAANKTSPVKHDKDDWGFEHGHKFHRKDAKSDSPDYGQWDVKDHPDRKPRK